jgi:hypothetical protein
VFRRKIQSAINEGRLVLHEKQVQKHPFPVNTMELQQLKVLVRSHQVKATKGKNVAVGEAKPDLRGKELTRKLLMKRPLMVEKHSRSLSKLLDMGGKGRPRLSVSNHLSLKRLGRFNQLG